MKVFALILFVALFSRLSQASNSLKIEGSCSGSFKDGSPVSFTYYSDFDGCKEKSQAAISFTEGVEGLEMGERQFIKNRDVYSFKDGRLSFANSTGNTEGILELKEKVKVSCEIRDYEYAEEC